MNTVANLTAIYGDQRTVDDLPSTSDPADSSASWPARCGRSFASPQPTARRRSDPMTIPHEESESMSATTSSPSHIDHLPGERREAARRYAAQMRAFSVHASLFAARMPIMLAVNLFTNLSAGSRCVSSPPTCPTTPVASRS